MPLSSFLPPFTAPPTFLSPARCFFFSYVTCILPFKKQEEAPLWHRQQKIKKTRRRTRRRLRKRRQSRIARAAANTARFRNRVAAKGKSSPRNCSDPENSNGHPRESGRKDHGWKSFSAVAFSTSREPSFAKADHTKKASRSQKTERLSCALIPLHSLHRESSRSSRALCPRKGCRRARHAACATAVFPRGCAGSLP